MVERSSQATREKLRIHRLRLTRFAGHARAVGLLKAKSREVRERLRKRKEGRMKEKKRENERRRKEEERMRREMEAEKERLRQEREAEEERRRKEREEEERSRLREELKTKSLRQMRHRLC